MSEGPRWQVEVSARALRDFDGLPPRIVPAIIEFIYGPLAENPMRLSGDLEGELDGYRSARRGDYRVLIALDEVARIVRVHRIGHRAHIYHTR